MATAKRNENRVKPDARKEVSKNKRSQSVNKSTKNSKNKKSTNSEIYGIIAIACSLIFMFSLYTNKLGYLSVLSKDVFVSLFGIAAFLIPVYCLYASVKHYFLKQKITLSTKYWGVTGLVIVTIVLIQTMNMDVYYVKGSLVNSFGKFLETTSYLNGGFVIYVMLLPVYKLMGAVGIYIIVAAVYVICSILIFNYNIRGTVKHVQTKGKKIQKKASNTITKQREKLESRRLDDTMSGDEEFRDEVFNRIKMIDFMNNVSLGEDEFSEVASSKHEEEIDDEESEDNIEILTRSFKNDIVYCEKNDDCVNITLSKEKEITIEKEIESNNKLKIEETKDIKIQGDENESYLALENQNNNIAEKVVENKKMNSDQKNTNPSSNTKVINENVKIQKEEEVAKNEYSYPSADLLNINTRAEMNTEEKQELLRNANKLEEVLLSFGVQAELLNVTKGPSVTRYEIQPKAGIKVNKIVNLSHDIALGLAAAGEVRIEAPIPGKAAVGIEIPNKKQTPVYFREIIESKEFNSSSSNIACALGKSIEGKSVIADLSSMPHLLIAGATGSGKSVCINTLIVSILYKYSPDEIKLLMVDPKVVELSVYNGIPHLLIPVVTDPKKASGALFWAVKEMDRRYNLFAQNGARNITSYNNMADKGKVSERLPYIVIIVDELADLMMVCPGDVEEYICRLAQKARAAGMHLVIATQRPSVDVITGVIKANIPSRISFAVSSQIDSRTILDCGGAEKLLGRGDMLFHPIGKSSNMRVQGAFISEEEVEQVVEHVKCIENTIENNYEAEIVKHMESATGKGTSSSEDQDELLDEAIKLIVDSGQVSASFIQRRLKIGFNRAARMIEQMEELGIISEKDGNKPRQVLISKDEIENL